MAAQLLILMLKFSLPPHISSWVKTSQIKTNYKTFQLTKKSKIRKLLGKITILILCRQSPLNLHQFPLTRDCKYGLVGTDRNVIWRYFASIRLYLALLFIMSIPTYLWNSWTQRWEKTIQIYLLKPQRNRKGRVFVWKKLLTQYAYKKILS